LVNNKEVRLQLALAVFVGREPSPQLQMVALPSSTTGRARGVRRHTKGGGGSAHCDGSE
jgi:hypothetical protein